MADFFLVWTASPFTLRTFGAQISWHIISRKALFAPQRFLSNKLPIHFAGENGNRNMFLNGKWHVQNENGHQSPQSQIPDLCPTTVKILTHLISRYQLPLNRVQEHFECYKCFNKSKFYCMANLPWPVWNVRCTCMVQKPSHIECYTLSGYRTRTMS